MATRLFFHNAANALSGTFPTGEQSAALTATKPVTNSGTLLTMNSLTGTAMTTLSVSSSATVAAQALFCRYFCSDTFDVDQPVGGGNQIITLNIANRESSTSMDFGEDLRASVYVWRPSTGSLVGYVNDGDVMAGDVEPGSALSIRVNQGSVTSTTTVNALAGDVLICEVWQLYAQASAVAPTGAIYYDGTTVNVTPNAVVTNHASFIDFSVSTLTFGTPPVLSISCSFGQTLATVGLSADAAVPHTSAFANTLAEASLTGSAVVPHTSTLNATLADATMAGTGLVGASLGTFNNTLASVTLTASAVVPHTSTFANTLGSVSLTGSAVVPHTSSYSNTLAAATMAGTGTVVNPQPSEGTFNITLATMTLAGIGTSGSAQPVAPAAQDTSAGSGASRVRNKFRVPDTAVAPNPIDAILEPLPAPEQAIQAPKVATMSMVTHLAVAPTPTTPPVPFVRLPVVEEDEYSDDDMIMLAMLV